MASRVPMYDKQELPVSEVRWFLEPGPVVLVSSAHEGQRNVMTIHSVFGHGELVSRRRRSRG